MDDFRNKMARLAVEHLADAVIMVDPEHRVTEFNPAAERLTGYSRAQALGRFCGDLLRGKLCGERCPLRASIGELRTVRDAESVILTKDDVQVPVMISTSCLLGGDGKLLGAVEVIKDLSEIKRTQRERQNLVSMLAHDMKSPAIVIDGFASRLLRGRRRDGKERRELEIIRDEARRLAGFINDFLEYSRLESGIATPAFSACDLEAEACAVVESLKVEAQAKNMSLEVHAPASPLLIDGDCALLRRALTNLVSNALKFTGPGGKVAVDIVAAAESAQVRVSDTGCGIPDDELPYIFEPFHRGSAKKPGTGLGLAIVEAVVSAHNGRVFVASEPGVGSTFTLHLPVAQPSRGAAPAVKKRGDPGRGRQQDSCRLSG